MNKKRGFILIYTALIAGIIAVIIGITVHSVLTELKISRDEGDSQKAFYAADTGIECARFYQKKSRAFESMTAQTTYNCGFVGADFTVPPDPLPDGTSPGTGDDCVGYTSTFNLTGFSNGACANVEITVTPVTIYVGGAPVKVCDIRVISTGRNSCGAAGANLVERTRWEDI
ncbi:MAG: hypothetical protein A2909_02130 [Candidatus Tagabacteria bacterium RIFCSPLOWO2_01_FULL_39_11]|uniref:Type 4 fimbrial biogenesis protein PilX N-terminal domain-containing protein n=1 Tax=Candidatus Tagabacteria bacterium RIFCSPLOWO2_01_FULL_39_11 TaxID=1802295 RepID=A0A1G2LMR6_9BACT|nr:MAG: hypothetical protein A2909_02130 [Candidatus Tagabacteria bacterium RIFCSPLOWO2_01_FULL_39_11]